MKSISYIEQFEIRKKEFEDICKHMKRPTNCGQEVPEEDLLNNIIQDMRFLAHISFMDLTKVNDCIEHGAVGCKCITDKTLLPILGFIIKWAHYDRTYDPAVLFRKDKYKVVDTSGWSGATSDD